MADTRYVPFRETFLSNDLINIPVLNDALDGGAIPGDLVLDSLSSYLLSNDDANLLLFSNTFSDRNRLYGFDKADVPVIKGLGVFCNMGDCLVDISEKNKSCKGMVVQLSWNAYDAMDSLVTSHPILTTPVATVTNNPRFRFNTLNAIMDFDISLLNTIQNHLTAYSDPDIAYCAIEAEMLPKLVEVDEQAEVSYSTINLNPLIGAKRLTMWVTAVIDHTKPLVKSLAAPASCSEAPPA